MKVAIAEDSAFFREGLVHLLAAAGIKVGLISRSGADLLARLDADELPDVVIVDIRMPPTHSDEGLAVAEQVRGRFPAVAVLVLSAYVDASHATRLLATGPQRVGMLSKDQVSDLPVLLDALERLCAGEIVIDQGLVARLFARPEHERLLARLSGREADVLEQMALGRSNRGVARELQLGERTVETYSASIFDKLEIPQDRRDNRRVRAVLLYLKGNPAI